MLFEMKELLSLFLTDGQTLWPIYANGLLDHKKLGSQIKFNHNGCPMDHLIKGELNAKNQCSDSRDEKLICLSSSFRER